MRPTGPFKDFALSEDQWQTLHIAAWLHDCGKVTTPEYVVDKATKLETIYDRLHEVRMRFEVVKREAEVACWQAIAAGEPSASRLAELHALWEGAGRGIRLRRRMQRGRRVHGARQGRATAPHRRAHMDAHARRPHRPRSGGAAAQERRFGSRAARRGAAAGGPARAHLRARRARQHRPRQPVGLQNPGPRTSLQPRRTPQSRDRPGHAQRRGPLQDQRAYRRDDPHAVAPAVAAASGAGGRVCRRTPRKDGRQRLSAAAEQRRR